MDEPPMPSLGRVIGLERGLVPTGTLRFVLDDDVEVSVLQYEWDAGRRVIDLGNIDTPNKAHRRRGYAMRLLAALVEAAPGDSVLRAVGLHSCEGLAWMARAREHGYQIHQNFWCFKDADYDRCARDQGGGDPCPVQSDERVAWIKPAQERNRRLDARVRHLEKKLSEHLGEQAWRESGLGAPDNIDQLKRRIIQLEQENVDLAAQLAERDDELAAARSANRELIARLNTRH